jgi:tRNA_anti-like
MKKIWRIFFACFAIALTAAAYGLYLFNKKPVDIRQEAALYKISAVDLLADFNKDEPAANLKYLDKVIAVKGKVAEIKIDTTGQATVFLDAGDPLSTVTCSFYNEEAKSVENLKKGNEITIKGNCTGKLMDVILNKCSIFQ